jgi:hypothetical protein
MPASILYDTVTLLHFAACNRLDILRDLSRASSPPFWVERVHGEVEDGANRLLGPPRTQCRYILSQTWLGDPHEPLPADQLAIFSIRTALDSGLGGDPSQHLGEAQTIYVAEELGAVIATDDGPAFSYARERLGLGNAIDTVDLLRQAVAAGLVTADDAARLVARIRAAGRFLRKVHGTLTADDFR